MLKDSTTVTVTWTIDSCVRNRTQQNSFLVIGDSEKMIQTRKVVTDENASDLGPAFPAKRKGGRTMDSELTATGQSGIVDETETKSNIKTLESQESQSVFQRLQFGWMVQDASQQLVRRTNPSGE